MVVRMNDMRPRGRRRRKRTMLVASLMGLGVLTVAARPNVVRVAATEQAASLNRGLGIGPAPTVRLDGAPPYEFAQPSGEGGAHAAPITVTGVS